MDARYGGCRAFGICSILLLCAACAPELPDVYSPREWRDMFERAGGWVPLPFPDSKYRPGSIIQVTAEGMRWIDHLQSCGYPAELLAPEMGSIPAISFSKQRSFDSELLLNYAGISAGPSFDKVKKVILRVSDHSADALRLLRLKVWMEEPDNRAQVSAVCMDELEKPHRYLVTESFRVAGGSYTLVDESGAAIKLTAPAIGSLLDFEPSVDHRVTADGKLEIDAPAIFAVRKAIRMAGDFEILGGGTDQPESADAIIGRLYEQREIP